jgi:hypothetical protein
MTDSRKPYVETAEARAARLERWTERLAEALDGIRPRLNAEEHGRLSYTGAEVVALELTRIGWRPPRGTFHAEVPE